MIISNFPSGEGVSLPKGLPNFKYSGEYSILDDGSVSGEWKIALTTSGTLTLANVVNDVTIQSQGGGGGGGAGGNINSGVGSDGEDGSIESTTQTLAAGTYTVEIGAAGEKGSDDDGGTGGTTSFADILTAAGGAGGEYYGGKTLTHSGLYGTRGQGGDGGTSSQYTGTVTSAYTIAMSGSNGMKVYSSADINSSVNATIAAGSGRILHYGHSTPETVSGNGGTFYKVMGAGTSVYGYILTSEVSSVEYVPAYDTRVWYGYEGNPGIVILSGKA